MEAGNLEIFPGSYKQYQKLLKGEYKNGEDLDQEILQMKKAELYAKLEEAAESEREEIINELDVLADK